MEQETLTGLGIEIMPVELLGKNPSYRKLAEPKNQAYPNGFESSYSDDYLLRLNQVYSLTAILGEKLESTKKGERLEFLVMDSPLQNTEAEGILARILVNSAQAEEWQPAIIDVSKLTDTSIKTAEEYLAFILAMNLRRHDSYGMMDKGVIYGIAKAKNGGFVLPTQIENKVIIVPSQEFVEYFATKK